MLTDVKRRGIDSQVGSGRKPGAAAHADHRRAHAIRGRARTGRGRGGPPRANRQRGCDESVHRRDSGAGQLSDLRSQRAAEARDNPVARQNHAVSVPFEPGSVFKVMTLSAALETTSLTPDSPSTATCGVLTIAGRVIHDSHVGVYGIIPMARFWRTRATSAPSRSACGWARRTCTSMYGVSVSASGRAFRLPAESSGKSAQALAMADNARWHPFPWGRKSASPRCNWRRPAA